MPSLKLRKLGKEGALELSIGTIVVIVIAMAMLVLGLVLVRNIFELSGGTVDLIDAQVRSQINNLFNAESGNVVVHLGSANVAKVKPGERFNVAIGAQHPDGDAITRDTLEYRLELNDESGDNCISALGGKPRAEALFITEPNIWHQFDQYSGSTAYALIEVDVPKGTARCTQKVSVDMRVKTESVPRDGDFFLLEVAKEGIF